jgi:hypothetical protein
MGTFDIRLYTATCDVGGCEEIHGDTDDFGWDWYEYHSEAETAAIRIGWTKIDDVLICKTDDEQHNEARGQQADTRPKPGPGQLALTLKG